MHPSLTVSRPSSGGSSLRSKQLASVPLLCLATVAVLLLLGTGSAHAAAPATVSVQVEGLTETKLPPTVVTTNTTPVIKDANPEHSCTGTSGAGALDVATGGSWGGTWFGSLGLSQETILGEVHVFDSASPANFFWAFWLNEKESSLGVCEVELQPGDRMLFFPSCYGEACPPTAPLPLGIEAPAVASVGEPIVANVKRFTAGGESSPVAGATVTLGAASAVTDASGHATLTPASAGALLMRASAPDSIRTEASVCVHSAGDGLCGSTGATGTGGAGGASGSTAAAYKGPFAVVARASGLSEGHVYSRGKSPRLLSGSVASHAAVTSVTLELRRSLRGVCSAYDGVRTRFVRARCGSGRPFQVSTSSSFSYLLPAALAPGRYVLDLVASDAAGNRTTLSRGTSRIVFYVR